MKGNHGPSNITSLTMNRSELETLYSHLGNTFAPSQRKEVVRNASHPPILIYRYQNKHLRQIANEHVREKGVFADV